MKKRAFAITLALILALGIAPQGIMAAEEAGDGYIEYLKTVFEDEQIPLETEEPARPEDQIDPADLDIPEETGEAEAGAAFNPYVFSEDGEHASVQVQPALMTIEAEEEDGEFVFEEEDESGVPAAGGDTGPSAETEVYHTDVNLKDLSVHVCNYSEPRAGSSGILFLEANYNLTELIGCNISRVVINADVFHFNENDTISVYQLETPTVDVPTYGANFEMMRFNTVNLTTFSAVDGYANGICVNDSVVIRGIVTYESTEHPIVMDSPDLKREVSLRVTPDCLGNTYESEAVIDAPTLHSVNFYDSNLTIRFTSGYKGASRFDIYALSETETAGAGKVEINGKTFFVVGTASATNSDITMNMSSVDGSIIHELKKEMTFIDGVSPQSAADLRFAMRTVHDIPAGSESGEVSSLFSSVQAPTIYETPDIWGVNINGTGTGSAVNVSIVFNKTDKAAESFQVYALSEEPISQQEYVIGSKTYYIRGITEVKSVDLVNETLYGSIKQQAVVELNIFGNTPLQKGEVLYFVSNNIYNTPLGYDFSGFSEPKRVVVPYDPPVLQSAAYDPKTFNATAAFTTEDLDSGYYELYMFTEKSTGAEGVTVDGKTYYWLGIQSFGGIPIGNATSAGVRYDKATGVVTLSDELYFGSNEKPAVGDTVYFGVETENGGISNLLKLVVGEGPVSRPVSIANATVVLNPASYIYTGEAITPKPVVTVDGKTLTEGTDYTLTYQNNVNAGKGRVTVTGKGQYTDSTGADFQINKAKKTIRAKNLVKTQNAKKKTYKLSVSTIGGKLTFKSNNQNIKVNAKGKVTVAKKYVGKATITITSAATSNCDKCTKKITVTVNPAKVSLSGAKNTGKKTVTVTWKKCAFNTITGYEIRCSADRNFKNGVKTAKVKFKDSKGNYNVSKEIKNKKWKNGKKVYFQIRTYQKVGKKTFKSAWSSKKSVKIKE